MQHWRRLTKCRTSISPIRKCLPVYVENIKSRSETPAIRGKNAVIDAFHRGLLSQAVQEKLLADIDAQLLRLEFGETNKAVEQQPSLDLSVEHFSEE